MFMCLCVYMFMCFRGIYMAFYYYINNIIPYICMNVSECT